MPYFVDSTHFPSLIVMVAGLDPPNPLSLECLITHGSGEHIHSVRKHPNYTQ